MTDEEKKKYQRDYYLANKEKIRARVDEWRKNNPDKVKNRYKNKRQELRDKDSARGKAHYIKNKERVLATVAKYRNNNKEIVRQRDKDYAKRNPHKLRAIKSRRKKKVIKATPKWLTKDQLLQIEFFYKEAIRLEQETGIPHQVDHIIPIQGKEVCGLHVPWNLQVLTQKENRQKSNKLLDNVEPIVVS